ncbi:MAG: hypothetical protein MR332_08330 [Fusicatenibacter sp.]|nr:hypothetical protein [Fusicatenibacter sp.]
MKNTKINLHTDRKRTPMLIVFFSVVSILMNTLIGISVDSSCSHLLSLINSSYEYSAMTDRTLGQDDYLRFDAGIYFSLAADSKTSLNADIVMQSNESLYTDSVYWNAEKLEQNEIAISYSISQKNNKAVGDKLYSKHIANGAIQEYMISQVLPDVASTRLDGSGNYNEGIIIMGYDQDYAKNFSYENVVYTNKHISELVAINPRNVLYREDEILSLLKRVSPYLVVHFLLSILLCVGLVLSLTNNVKINLKRQMMLGFEKKKLDHAFSRYIGVSSFCSVLLSLISSLIWMRILSLDGIMYAFYGIKAIAEILVILIIIKIMNRRFWR